MHIELLWKSLQRFSSSSLFFYFPLFFWRVEIRLKKKYRSFLLQWPRVKKKIHCSASQEKCYKSHKTKINWTRSATASQNSQNFSKLVSSPYIGTFGLRLPTFSPPLNDSGCLLPFTPIADLASHYLHHFLRHHHYHLPHCSDSFPARSHLQFLSKQALGRESNNSLFSKFFNRRWPSGRKPKLPGKRTTSFNRN